MGSRRIFFAAVVAVWGSSLVAAAEIHFRTECRVDGGLVLLGDLAEIYDADAEQVRTLSKIDIMPAPPAKERRVLRAREIQDLLHLRGVNPNAHRFTGASQITLNGASESVGRASSRPTPVLSVPMQTINASVRTALQHFLAEKTGSDCEWVTKFDLKPEQAQLLCTAGNSLKIEGGESPWTGLQNVNLTYPTHDGPARVALAVQVQAPPSIVVARQAINRGAIVRASDVRLQSGEPVKGSVVIFRSLEEVIGKEATRGIVEGQILDDSLVRRPVLVQRSDIVTVYARSAGLRVRTSARAIEAGGEGDLIRVESMTDRKSYFARVSGPQEVEVFAHAPVATSDAPASSPDSRVQPAGYQARAAAGTTSPTSSTK